MEGLDRDAVGDLGAEQRRPAALAISPAALLVKVMARIASGATPCSRIR